MPWKLDSLMSQRQEFIQAVLHRAPGQSIRDVCVVHGIAEKTGHKWLARFEAGGPAALADRSHVPHRPPHQLAPAIITAILALRDAEPSWGGRKLRDVLRKEQPDVPWPAASTITQVLTRAGRITPRRRTRRERSAWASTQLTQPMAPNDVWAADFKGEFRLGARGVYCYPLTLSDLYSRYVLHVHGLPSTASAPAQQQCQRCFEQYGLPRVIRTDNGSPFGAPTALGGLSALAAWWIRLGIRPERIEKGAPQQNGAHERMHRTLKAEVTRPASATMEGQQVRFDQWTTTFNHRRPHDSLAGDRPADRYTASPRPYPRRLPMLEYPDHMALRRVWSSGVIKFRMRLIFLTTVLAGEYVGLAETADAEWTVYFGPLALGTYSLDAWHFTEHLAWTPST